MGELKILVTGAAGFLGSHLCEKLLNLQHKVIGIDNMIGGTLDNLPKNLEFRKIDCCDFQKLNKVMKNIAQLINESGGEIKHLVKLVVYITDIKNREAVYRTIGQYTKGVYPVSTGLVVNSLARPEWLVEVDAIAVIPS